MGGLDSSSALCLGSLPTIYRSVLLGTRLGWGAWTVLHRSHLGQELGQCSFGGLEVGEDESMNVMVSRWGICWGV